MKALSLLLSGLFLTALTSNVTAQDWGDYHPSLSDNLLFSIGAYRSSNAFNMRADFGDLGEEIDFDDLLGVEDTSTILDINFRWKFGKSRKWTLAGQYFGNKAEGETRLDEDIEWEGIIFREGSFVGAGVSFDVIRAFVGRSFVMNDRHDFGLGIGIHNLDLSAYIEGEIKINDETSGFQREKVGASQILPNIGGWYKGALSPRWMFHARIDWISANVGKYDGSLWNTSAGFNFQAWRHVGFDLSWQYFNLDISIDDDNWIGGAELTYSGPVLGVTANW